MFGLSKAFYDGNEVEISHEESHGGAAVCLYSLQQGIYCEYDFVEAYEGALGGEALCLCDLRKGVLAVEHT